MKLGSFKRYKGNESKNNIYLVFNNVRDDFFFDFISLLNIKKLLAIIITIYKKYFYRFYCNLL